MYSFFSSNRALMPIWLGTQQKTMSLLAKFKDTLSYRHPNQGMFQLHMTVKLEDTKLSL